MEAADSPLNNLDTYLVLVAGLIVVTHTWTYYLLPPCMPDKSMSGGKPTFFQWALGTGCLPFVRRYSHRPMTCEDFPREAGSGEHNIENFCNMILGKWNPKAQKSKKVDDGPKTWMTWIEELFLGPKESLRNFAFRFSLPWWGFCHLLLGMNRALELLNPYIITCVIRYMEQKGTDDVLSVPFKLAVLQLLIRLAKSAAFVQCEAILAIRAFDQIWAGMELVVLRKMYRLSPETVISYNVSSTYAQQIMDDSRQLAAVLWGTPLRSVIADSIVGFYALKQLGDLYGMSIFLFGFVSCIGLSFLSHFCVQKQFALGGGVWFANLTRQNTLNMMFEQFRELRMYNWTDRCAKVLEDSRTLMLKENFKSMKWGILSGLFNTLINPWIAIVAFFVTVFIHGQRVSFEKGLLAYTYMTMVSGTLMLYSMCRGTYLMAYYQLERIENFLRLPESGDEPPRRSDSSKVRVGDTRPFEIGDSLDISGARFTVRLGKPEDGSEHDLDLLTDMEIHPKQGELILVTGATGSGKSTILMALLGEMRLTAGSATLPKGTIAYQPQVPYLLDGTIKDNILFGVPAEKCNEAHLQRALEASQLGAEMRNPKSTLSAKREYTRVGKRGSQLSGGQRARVNLARTVYAALSGTRLVLLDDPVASVDNEVLQAAWEDVVLGEMRDVTRIVAVNTQLLERLAPTADRLIVVQKPLIGASEVVFNGPPAEVASQKEVIKKALGGEFDLSRQSAFSPSAAATRAAPAPLVPSPEAVDVDGAGSLEAGVEAEEAGKDAEGERRSAGLALADFLNESRGLMEFLGSSGKPLRMRPSEWKELQEHLTRFERSNQHPPVQAVRPKHLALVSLSFCRRTWALPVLTVVLSLAKNFATPIQYITCKMWENLEAGWGDRLFMLAITCQVTTFSFIDVALGNLDGLGNLLSSLSLRKEMDEKVMQLGMPYFWGLRGIEEQFRKLVYADLDSLTGLFRLPMGIVQVLLGAAVPAWNVPILWLVLAVTACCYWRVTKISEWQQAQLFPARADVIAKLDLQVSDQFDSLCTIRALKRTGDFDKALQPSMIMQMYWNYLHRSAQMLVENLSNLIGGAFLIFATQSLVRMKMLGVEPAMALASWQVTDAVGGMANAAVNMYLPFQNCLARYRELETFLDTPYVDPTGGSEPPKGWPAEGRATFENVTFRYANHMPAAVQNVSFQVRAREKLGIVGKTGSGKSTCASLLLRLGPLKGVLPSSGGRVLVDGVDLATLQVESLRRVIAVVPQEPTFFPWTLKENVGQEFTDAEVLNVLEWCNLDPRHLTGKSGSDDLREALYTNVNPGITVGQQQLLMAARALVRRPKIIILDECTAALDRESADRLLEVVSKHTEDTTVLSIAHRLRFVLKSDRILVLGHLGTVLGCDTPMKLLEDTNGYFATNLRLEQSEESDALVAAALEAAASAAAAKSD